MLLCICFNIVGVSDDERKVEFKQRREQPRMQNRSECRAEPNAEHKAETRAEQKAEAEGRRGATEVNDSGDAEAKTGRVPCNERERTRAGTRWEARSYIGSAPHTRKCAWWQSPRARWDLTLLIRAAHGRRCVIRTRTLRRLRGAPRARGAQRMRHVTKAPTISLFPLY